MSSPPISISNPNPAEISFINKPEGANDIMNEKNPKKVKTPPIPRKRNFNNVFNFIDEIKHLEKDFTITID